MEEEPLKIASKFEVTDYLSEKRKLLMYWIDAFEDP